MENQKTQQFAKFYIKDLKIKTSKYNDNKFENEDSTLSSR
tara:strand:- start:647 stop:766 length:120 start_codon:yes stop_codon:yes gene_type:complete